MAIKYSIPTHQLGSHYPVESTFWFVDDFADLPTNAQLATDKPPRALRPNDIAFVITEGSIYTWTGSAWSVIYEDQIGGGTAHAMLDGGTMHTDSVAQTVSRGSLIYGNTTPKWDELTVGAASSVLRSDGTDPAWTAAPTIGTSVTTPIVYGSAADNGDLTIKATSSATATTANTFINPSQGQVCVGTGTPSGSYQLLVNGTVEDGVYVAKFTSTGSAGVEVKSNLGGTATLGLATGDNNWALNALSATGSLWFTSNGGNGPIFQMVTSGGNIAIANTDAFPSAGTRSLIFADGTAPSGLASNTAGLFAEDVSGTVNMYAINEAGESTRLSFPAPQTYTESNVSVDRTYDADATTLAEVADVLGTLIADLRARGIVA